MSIKAIETRYKGYRFRSRLEARWAVFFDALGVKWDYERQGFRLPSGPYLPDFWLPDVCLGSFGGVRNIGSWVEIKGQEPSDHEIALAKELTLQSKKAVWLFWSVPGQDEYGLIEDCRFFQFMTIWDKEDVDMWRQNPEEYSSAIKEFDEHGGHVIEWGCESYYQVFGNYRFQEAIKAARSARFEHGESG